MHLINDPWLPVRRSDGQRQLIRPCDLVSPEIVDVDVPRIELAVAARTFLIGLVTTAGIADSERDWLRLYDNPPTADALVARLDRFAPAFSLLGEGPRFCQHSSARDHKEPLRIASLLIDGPNEQSDKRNLDIMVDVLAFSPAITALAIYALQQFAGSGGSGHLQSMRRSSPMATLVNGGSTLWHSVWLNVETREQVAARSPRQWQDASESADVFPWLGTPRLYADGLSMTTSDAHPLQVYWQMPRRLWIDSVASTEHVCGVTGERGAGLVTSYRQLKGGVKYTEEWRHPHVPHVRRRDVIEPARTSARASRIGDWLGVVYRDQHGEREPAAVVTTATTHRVWALADASPRVDVFGFQMRTNKVLGLISHVMPIVTVDPASADDLRAAIEKGVLAVEMVAEMLRKTAFTAVVGPETKDAGKRTASRDADNVRMSFLTSMEPHVEASILAAAAALRADTFDPLAHTQDLHRNIRREAEAAFDTHLPTDTWVDSIERRVRQRWQLTLFLNGADRLGAALFAILHLPTPQGKKEPKNAA